MRFLVHTPLNGVPPLGSVLTPTMTRPAQAWSSRGQIYGQPGTQAIHAPNPAAVVQDRTALASAGVFSPRYAPEVIYPSLYWEANDPKERAPVARISDNQMPVPALRAPEVIKASPYKARKGGQRQVAQPQVVQVWRPMFGNGGR